MSMRAVTIVRMRGQKFYFDIMWAIWHKLTNIRPNELESE